MTQTIHSALQEKQTQLSKIGLPRLLKQDRRFAVMEWDELLFDFSKSLLDPETFQLLLEWAKAENLQEQIQNLYRGLPVNQSERRPALHMALRGGCTPDILVDGKSVSTLVDTELRKMLAFVEAIRNRRLLGFTQKPIQTVVNLGVGGSDLGVVLCLEALQEYSHPDLQLYCVSSLGGIYLHKLLQKLDPETTLFIVSSKSFTTTETLTNAKVVRQWFTDKTGQANAWQQHFVGVSANRPAMQDYGILPERQFYVWDWVGGRYSVSSAIGLPVAISVGMERFLEMQEGMRRCDAHFLKAPFEENIPVVMGLLAVWTVHYWGATAHAILPYDERLQKLPAYLAQLLMESLGKRVKQEGQAVSAQTCPIVFGEMGTNAQHSFFQLLHQGTRFVTADFIAIAKSCFSDSHSHRLTLANMLAQSRALALGVTEADVRAELQQKGYVEAEINRLLPHKIHPGNRPSCTILLQQLTPKTLGMLIALYEHSVFVQAVLWGVNPFDQWGVELGKTMAEKMFDCVGRETAAFDFSTNHLLNYIARCTK